MASIIANKFPYLQSPAYCELDTDNIHEIAKNSLVTRVFYAALPFIALHRPFEQIVTLTMDSMRTITSLSNFLENKDARTAFRTVIAISAMSGTVFMHPLGLSISILNSLISNLPEMLVQLQSGDLQALIPILQQGLYLCTIFVGSLEIITVSFLLSMAVEIIKSKNEFQKGHLIEAVSHLLMSAVRFSQSIPYMSKVAEKNNVPGTQMLENTMNKIRDRSAIFFYRSARSFMDPLWKTTDEWLKTVSLCKDPQASTYRKTISVAKSAILSSALLPFSIGGLLLGQAFHFTAFNLATKPYIHLKGKANAQDTSEELSIFQLNTCLTAGGFSRLFGGVTLPNEDRVKAIAGMIKEANPDVVCLQEVSDLKDAFSLYDKLSSKFSDFYLGIGPTLGVFFNNSGLFACSNQPMSDPQFHSFKNVPGTELAVNKGFFSFSTEYADVINTHLSPSSDDLHPTKPEAKTREIEQKMILEEAHKLSSKNNKPVIVLGDFNTNVGPLFDECTAKSNPNPKATCETGFLVGTNFYHKLKASLENLEIDHLLSFFEKSYSIFSRAIPTFDPKEPKRAISDHLAIVSTIRKTR